MPINASNETISIHEVFKSKALTKVQKNLFASNRQQAIENIQSRIPTNIARIKDLLSSSESDEDHPLHPGQVDKNAYLKAVFDRQGAGASPGGEGTGRRFLDRLDANEIQIQVIRIMDRECQDLYFVAQELRMWLDLEVPVIEDGNSFGTEVQEHVMNELTEACKQANAMQNSERQHHIDRQKMASQWAAHPNIEDYAYSIAGSDRLDHFLARCHLRNILRIYTSLLHKMSINWSKVIEPKGQSHTGGMY